MEDHMRSKILAVTTTLALGTGLGGIAFATVRGDSAPAPAVVPAAVSATPDPCSNPASDDPECVVVVRVPAPAAVPAAPGSVSDDGTADQGRGDRAGAPAPVRTASSSRTSNRGPGSATSGRHGSDDAERESDDSGRDGGGDDGTADQGRGDDGRHGGDDAERESDDSGRDGGGDDGTADQGRGDR
jgi:hypothetical protein